ncbi:type IV pilus twitching motility protein PilT [Campylobacter geochelonis]|uniref:Twitching mobility protein n=1 Tax=Campylobacter geochelonis TaxID=1780362 RepID=A0A128EC22_9BACT|nr:PilT/PilU family type 4a pilus ATPase [Campylobacter geochelonis]QKF70622.1 type II/IV secretion system protein, PilT/PilU family [Campylobacter geochelonis]CZE45912.1 twitching mobility protein [Campylobacter geochelonis]
MSNIYSEDIQKKKLNEYLNFLIKHGGSDLHIKSNSQIRGRINGDIVKFSQKPFPKSEALALAKELLRGRFDEFIEKKSLDFTYRLNDEYRFRVNIFFQIDGVSAVFRTIPTKIPTIDDLRLPQVLKKICDESMRGLVLVTGPTGSGKTTTIASMLNRINNTRASHIVTIEDPVEFVFEDSECIVNQRALGQDCNTFSDSLRAALREDPDIIFVGEMRDLETIETALHAAETGHLVFSTLHTLDAKESINRIIGMFEPSEQSRIKISFASVLEAVISQRLAVTTDGRRTPVVEVLRKNVRIKDMILSDRYSEVTDAIRDGKNTYGMQTFDQHLLELYTAGIISKEEALDKSTNRSDLNIGIKNIMLKQKADGQSGGDEYKEDIKLQDV